MQPPNPRLRINLAELKAQIVKKLGPEGSKQYFYYLNRFLSLKLTKVEFDKLCLRILGRENIPLHNQLIRSILRNACGAKTPPPASQKEDISKHGNISADGHQQNGSHAIMTQASGSPGLSNGGDMLPLSPRKARTGFRDRRTGDRRSALGPNGKISFAPQLSAATQSSDFNDVLENGDLNPPHTDQMFAVRRSPDVSAPSCSKDQMEFVVRDDRKEASVRSPVRAPLGVPFCPVSVGGARRAPPPSSSSRYVGALNDVALLDSQTLRERMEQIATFQGLEGVSVDSANILNHGLDTYMKGLIRSCIELVGSRSGSGHELTKNNTNKHHSHMKLVNGVKPGHLYQMQNSGVQEQRSYSPISLQDFRVAMELNPRKLGEDWPMLLEKICIHGFEE